MYPEPVQVVDSPRVTANHEAKEVEIVEEETNGQVIDEGQASNDADSLVESDPHLNENHASVVAESASSPQEDTPKKSYASIVSSKTRGPTRIYVPANTGKVVPKTVKQPPNSSAEVPASESSAPTASDNVPDSKETRDEGILAAISHLK